MYKITNININFFKKKKSVVLITTAMIGVGIFSNILYNSLTKDHYGKYNGNLYPRHEDRNVWEENYQPEHIETVTFTYHPSNNYKMRVFKGTSEKSHYRIEILDPKEILHSEAEPIECSEWMEIPEDGLITVKRSDFSDKQYGNEFLIRYSNYNADSDKNAQEAEIWESSTVFASNCSKEEIEEYNEIREKTKENVKKCINENDSEFDKVKKTYDYIINHTAYDHSTWYPGSEARYYNINFMGTFKTDCTGYADIFNSALNDIGIESYTVVDNTNGHVWNMVRVDGKYYHLDATYSDTGSWTDTSKYRYFLVSDNFMRKENRWFVKEKDIPCNEVYDLTGFVNEMDVKSRGFN